MTASTEFSGLLARAEALRRDSAPNLASLRKAAWNGFEAHGWPTRKQEAWRNLNLGNLEEQLSNAVSSQGTPGTPAISWEGPVLRLGGELPRNLPAGVTVSPLDDALPQGFGTLAAGQDNPFISLNTALFTHGVLIDVTTSQPQPLYLVHEIPEAGQACSVHPRVFVRLAPSVECTLIEEFPGAPESAFVNPVLEADVAANGRLTHHRVIGEQVRGWHIGAVGVRAAADAVYTGYSLVVDGNAVRIDLHAALLDSGAQAELLGVYATDANQVVDHHTHIRHQVRETSSRQLYRGILGGKSRGVFNGRITIDPDAQGVSADQINNNLLLSDQALVHTNPQLEIYADDVQCRHGATVGQLASEKLFYMQARGIPKAQAQALLTQAFLDEVLDDVEPEVLRAHIQETVKGRFFARV